MEIKNGVLKIGKRERQAIEVVLRHCEADISYGGGGTFTDNSLDNFLDQKEVSKARKGIENIKWILENF